ncbi:MAG: BamA/TamA family outer membrane protein [Dinoroseobacter sp.]|nr:BamA/TamA family outer membrane protein [Dinoroseobacter sp.]
MAVRFFVTSFAACGLAFFSATAALSQTTELVTEPLERSVPEDPDEIIGFQNGNFVAVPVPFSSPGIGGGLALGGGYLFKLDPEARTSVVGIGALGTEKGSEAYAALANVAFGENKWLLNVLAGDADLRYDFILDRLTIPLKQEGELFNIGLAYGVTKNLSFGAKLRYLDTSVGVDLKNGGGLPPELLPDAKIELVNVSLTADWDRRDDTDYATDGFRLYGELMNGGDVENDERRYEKLFGNLDGFFAPRDRTVLAGRATACGASDDTPFFDKCSIGATDNFRGFNATRFLDNRTLTFQAEIRQRFTQRLGGVAFAGVGWSGEAVDELWDNGANSAAGLGLRYRVSRNFPVDFSVDVSRNDRGDDLVYIYVGQRW